VPYSPVYSAAFIQYTASTPNPSFEVPSDFTAVVRQVTCVQDIGAYNVNVNVQDSEAAPELVVFTALEVGTFELAAAEMRVVVPGGGLINVALSAIGDDPSVYVGGYLLRNVVS
jgi:hypothetical protein